MADLGYKPFETLESPPKNEVSYPSLTLEDETLDEVKGEHECKVGDEYQGTVVLRVKSVAEDEDGGQRITFDVVELNDFAPGEGTEYAKDEEEPTPAIPPGSEKVPPALRIA